MGQWSDGVLGIPGTEDGMAEKVVTFHTKSAEETERLGERIGSALEPGTVVAMTGDLGAGKTTLTKGIARGLGVSDLIHSPTFTLIHEHKGRLPVYHFDLYRLDSPEMLDDLGYEDYFYGDGVSIVEWSEKASELLPPDHLEIRITGDGDERTFEIKATGPRSEQVLAKIV
jgi:tRNA threonylcarbamoyladenosine biosynthesis protein TsaE